MTSAPSPLTRRRSRRIALFVVLAVIVVAASLASVVMGQYRIPLGDLPRILSGVPFGTADMDASVVWRIRVPRVLLGLLVGAALGVGGALTQAVFSNPLAEPSVIGVTSGAGVGASLSVVAGWSIAGTSTVAMAAFVTGIVTTFVVYQLSRFRGHVRVVNLILVGIATNAVAGAIISLMVFLAPTTSRDQIVFWQMGSLNGAQWTHVNVLWVIVLVGLIAAVAISRQLDVLALGDQAAGHVGIDVARLRLASIVIATMLTAGAVAYAGLIGFVGLIVPHIIRTVVGPSNRTLVIASAIAGAGLIVVADLVARTAVSYADLPIGIFTALVGGPTFFYLLRRMLRRGIH